MMQAAAAGEVNDTYERYVFRCRIQHSDETVNEFITSLRELIKTCNLCEHMSDHFLKDQVITFGLCCVGSARPPHTFAQASALERSLQSRLHR